MCSARSLGSARSSASSAAIFLFVAPARTRSGDRPVKRVAPLHLHEHLGRAADHGNIVELQKIQIRRRIHHAQRAINFKRIGGRVRRKSLADHDLKNIAGANVVLGFAHRRRELRLRQIRFHAQRLRAPRARLRQAAAFERLPRARDFAHRGVVFRAQAAGALGENVANDPHAMLHVVEDHQAEIKHHHAVVQAQIVAARVGNALDEPHHVVREISDRAGHQRRQPGHAHRTVARRQPSQLLDGIVVEAEPSCRRFRVQTRPRERNTSAGFAPANV